jgi:hypothetical protein
VMAFDNCTELERWRDLTEFATDMNKSGEQNGQAPLRALAVQTDQACPARPASQPSIACLRVMPQ